MLSSVLNSERAIEMNILIIRAFIKLRERLATHKELAQRIEKVEATQKQHTSVIGVVVEEIKKLKAPPPLRPNAALDLVPKRSSWPISVVLQKEKSRCAGASAFS